MSSMDDDHSIEDKRKSEEELSTLYKDNAVTENVEEDKGSSTEQA